MKPPLYANPPNRFSATELEYLEDVPIARPVVHEDNTQNILATNDSPDLGFRFSVNPYRGCMHSCAYCYARPSHEYLGFGAGTDFDTRIVVKRRAAGLLRQAFDKPSWAGELVMFSGVTDCYQPLEASLKLTRACLEVCAEYQNPAAIITKSPLIERDLDVLKRLSEVARVSVAVSIPFWRQDIARALEPGVATPKRRMQLIRKLRDAGIPVGVNVAPVIPGLDEDVPSILAQARDAGAQWAAYVLLRLPGSVEQVFETRLRASLPLQAEKVLHRIRETRGGKMYDPRFGHRQTGEGTYATAMTNLFAMQARRMGLQIGTRYDEPENTFRRPPKAGDQLALL